MPSLPFSIPDIKLPIKDIDVTELPGWDPIKVYVDRHLNELLGNPKPPTPTPPTPTPPTPTPPTPVIGAGEGRAVSTASVKTGAIAINVEHPEKGPRPVDRGQGPHAAPARSPEFKFTCKAPSGGEVKASAKDLTPAQTNETIGIARDCAKAVIPQASPQSQQPAQLTQPVQSGPPIQPGPSPSPEKPPPPIGQNPPTVPVDKSATPVSKSTPGH
jgi:hypothetical protein